MRALTVALAVAALVVGCGESRGTECASTEGVGCSCAADDDTPNDVACGPLADAPSVCCAEHGWPDGGECLCMGMYCSTGTDGDCKCHVGEAPPDRTPVESCAGTGTYCCIQAAIYLDYHCYCQDTPCEGMPITECSPAGIATSAFCDQVQLQNGGEYSYAATCR